MIDREKLERKLKEASAGEPNTWGFVAMFMDMIAECEVKAPSSGSSGEVPGYIAGIEKAAQITRYYLKHQNYPVWEDADEFQKGVMVACANIEKAILKEAI